MQSLYNLCETSINNYTALLSIASSKLRNPGKNYLTKTLSYWFG